MCKLPLHPHETPKENILLLVFFTLYTCPREDFYIICLSSRLFYAFPQNFSPLFLVRSNNYSLILQNMDLLPQLQKGCARRIVYSLCQHKNVVHLCYIIIHVLRLSYVNRIKKRNFFKITNYNRLINHQITSLCIYCSLVYLYGYIYRSAVFILCQKHLCIPWEILQSYLMMLSMGLLIIECFKC